MKRLWVFRSWINFTGTVLAISAVGLYVTKFVQQRPFGHPVISQSIKIISKNQRVRDLLGFPVNYISTGTNYYVQGQKSAEYYFKVQGPRGKLDTQLHVSSHNFTQLLKNSFDQLSTVLSGLEMQIKDLEVRLKKQKNKETKTQLSLSIQDKKLAVQVCKNAQNQQKIRLAKIHNIIYVPDKQEYSKMLIASTKKEPYEYTDKNRDLVLWSIDKLQVQLPNRNKITLIDVQQDSQVKFKQIPEDQIKPITLEEIQQKVNKDMGDMTEEELAAFSKYKNQYMYSKYGYVRGIMFIASIIGGYLLILTINKSKTTSLVNSVILHEAQKAFLKNQNVRSLMSYPAYTRIKWNHGVVGGGKKGSYIDCIIDVDGINSGKVTLKGAYDKSKEKYNYTKFQFEYRDLDHTIKKIDLLQ